eukprot:scaffold18875_cov22-Cyclotella_meneghiniana.AAC.3
MRRFAYFLPEVLANESLPYYRELCELISASKVTPSHDMAVVFYQDHKKKRREVLMVTVTLVIGIAIIALMRSARRK